MVELNVDPERYLMTLLTPDRLCEIAASLGRVIVVSGAGMSVPSGIPDFVTADKQWNEPVTREEALSVQFFEDEPEQFWAIFKKLFLAKAATNLLPSKAHLFVKDLEDEADVRIFTQNVDGLHQFAGSGQVTELHGTTSTLTCVGCTAIVPAASVYTSKNPTCFTCGARLKPNVVLYGENSASYFHLFNTIDAPEPGLLLVMGTSLTVAPVSYAATNALMNSPQLWRVYWDKNATEEHEPLFHHRLNTRFEDI